MKRAVTVAFALMCFSGQSFADTPEELQQLGENLKNVARYTEWVRGQKECMDKQNALLQKIDPATASVSKIVDAIMKSGCSSDISKILLTGLNPKG